MFKYTNHRVDLNGNSATRCRQKTRASYFIVELSSRRVQPAQGPPGVRAFRWTHERVMYLRDPHGCCPDSVRMPVLTCEPRGPLLSTIPLIRARSKLIPRESGFPRNPRNEQVDTQARTQAGVFTRSRRNVQVYDL